MGGKRKQTNRTKNNAKPSSSGRSAELLGENSNFFSFTSLKDGGSQPTQAPGLKPLGTEVLDLGIDPNFQVVLKRMGKKDATTKHKALHEFAELCQNMKEDDTNVVLPVWIKIYSSLILDSENRVREAAQLAHKAIVTNVGRNLAPFLKQVAPLWIISQYDTYPPAATAATVSFQQVFPPKKVTDVIVFCQEEILHYISDNLRNQTPQLLSKAEKLTDEEREARYQRLVASSLYGYALYLKTMPSDKLQNCLQGNKELVSSSAFWSYSTHSSPIIRAAWYSVLISLCQNAVFLLEGVYKNTVSSVFNNLDESDPVVLPVVWEATLHILVSIKEWWKYLNPDKQFFPKLLNILSKGAQGNANIIFPHLLPLLSSIPENIVADKDIFYKKFFSCLLTGFKQQSILQSPSESEAAATSYIECMRYLIMLHNADTDFCNMLLHEKLLDLLARTMEDPAHRLLIHPLYQELANLITYWQRNSSNQCYANILKDFWNKFPALCISSVDNNLMNKETLIYVLNCHTNLFSSFRHPTMCKKKNLKVKFSTDTEVNTETKWENEERSTSLDKEVSPETARNLSRLIETLAKKYLLITDQTGNKDIKIYCINQIWKIVRILESEKLILGIIPLEERFCSMVKLWLEDPQVPVEPILGLIFNALDIMKDSDLKNQMVNNLTELRLKEAIIEAIALTKTGKENAIQSWLKSEAIKNTLCNFVVDLVSENHEDSLGVLTKCLTLGKNGDFLVSNTTVCSIITTLVSLIESEENLNYLLIRNLLEALFKNEKASFFEGEHNEVVFKLIFAIFHKILIGRARELFGIWERSMTVMVDILGWKNKLIENYCSLCTSSVIAYFGNSDAKSIESMRNVCNTVIHLISSIVSPIADKQEKVATVLKLSEEFLSRTLNNARSNWEKPIEEICTKAEEICGNLQFPENPSENHLLCTNGKWNPLWDVNILGYSLSVVFCTKTITYMMDLYDDKGSPFPTPIEGGPLLMPNELSSLSELLLHFIYSLSLFKTLKKCYSSTSQYFDSMHFIDMLEEDLRELVQLLESSKQKELLSEIKAKCKGNTNNWGQTLQILEGFLDFGVTSAFELEKLDTEGEPSLALCIRSFRLKMCSSDVPKLYSDAEVIEMMNMIVVEHNAKASFAFDKDLQGLKAHNFFLTAEIARFFNLVLINHKELIREKDWDFVMIAIASWIQSIGKTDTHRYYKEFLVFCTAVCDLFVDFTQTLHENEEDQKIKKLLKEWNEVFRFDAHKTFSGIWNTIAEKGTNGNMAPISLLHIEKLSFVFSYIVENGTFLPTPPNTSCVLSWIKTCSSFIVSSCPAVQITSYKIFMNIAPLMLDIDSGIDENSCSKLSCSLIKDPFSNTHTVVKTMLQDFKIGITCSVQPYTDGYTYTRAYMMLWLVLLKMCKLGDSQLRYLYTLWIKENEVLPVLIENLLRLMPESVIHVLETNVKKTQDFFAAPPPFTFDMWTSERLGHLGCWIYCSLLKTLPALVRQWMVDADPKMVTLIDKLTSAFVSPILRTEEMEFIKRQDRKFDNIKIMTHPAAREVVAVYTLEESTTELIIQLTLNHPLSPPKVDISRLMVSSIKTRTLLMQLTLSLTHQNGTIWDGLMLWKSDLDKKFEGVEECYICFSIIHNSNHQLPKLSCQTCKKKFHTICLYKWFTTSNKSTCPICRNLF